MRLGELAREECGASVDASAVGLPAAQVPTTTFDSEGLLALPALQNIAGRRIVIFRGDEGRAHLGDTLRARGAEVDYVACYRRAPPSTGATGLEAILERREAHALTLTSAEGLDNLFRALGPAARARLVGLQAFAPHPRIVAAAQPAGLSATETAPGDGGLVAALLEWFGRHPASSPNS
jgi:uroporphyrinogen-III synthase